MAVMTKFILILSLVAVALASRHKTKNQELKAARHELVNAKKALESLTYSKEEQIYSINGYRAEDVEETINDVDDKCSSLECAPGKSCFIDNDGAPYCDCAEMCVEDDRDPFVRVCSTNNVTYPSQCELFRQKCVNPRDMDGEHLDYFGPCKMMERCNPIDLINFPERMRTWFLEVMRDLAERKEENGGLDDDEKRLEEESMDEDKPWRRPLHWKFFNMDVSPTDYHLSDEELLPMRAQLLPMEPCTDAFIAGCDTNDDDLISIIEWGKCMGLTEDEIQY
ncbi:SPARC-like [Asterias amurensis]|uniref:SPARC-like n=1 Tax=Asterias amurensis TaxID=7602 RepID=UPI003AB55681